MQEGHLLKMDELQFNQQERRQHIENLCKLPLIKRAMANTKSRSKGSFIYPKENTDLVACFIPKAGTQFWRDYFNNKYPNLNGSSYDLSKIYPSIYKAKTVIFTRHPLERLWSAYNDKFIGLNGDYMNRYYKIISHIRKEKITENQCVPPISFDEFLQLVLWEFEHKRVNAHWQIQSKRCDVCNTRYDVIGKIERFSSEFQLVDSFSQEHNKRVSSESLKGMLNAGCRGIHSKRVMSKETFYDNCNPTNEFNERKTGGFLR